MPINITKGNVAQFIVEFLDNNKNLTVPAGGQVEVTYTLGVSTALNIVTLSQNQSFFTGLWPSSMADAGPASWQVFALGSTTVAASTGNLNILGD